MPHPNEAYSEALEESRVLMREAVTAAKKVSETAIYEAADAAVTAEFDDDVSGNGDWPDSVEYNAPGIPLGNVRTLRATGRVS